MDEKKKENGVYSLKLAVVPGQSGEVGSRKLMSREVYRMWTVRNRQWPVQDRRMCAPVPTPSSSLGHLVYFLTEVVKLWPQSPNPETVFHRPIRSLALNGVVHWTALELEHLFLLFSRLAVQVIMQICALVIWIWGLRSQGIASKFYHAMIYRQSDTRKSGLWCFSIVALLVWNLV